METTYRFKLIENFVVYEKIHIQFLKKCTLNTENS